MALGRVLVTSQRHDIMILWGTTKVSERPPFGRLLVIAQGGCCAWGGGGVP